MSYVQAKSLGEISRIGASGVQSNLNEGELECMRESMRENWTTQCIELVVPFVILSLFPLDAQAGSTFLVTSQPSPQVPVCSSIIRTLVSRIPLITP